MQHWIRLTLAPLLLAVHTASAMYAPPDLVDVPIGRLIENLETRLKEQPDDVKLLHHLARAHAMVWAQGLHAEYAVKQHKGRDPGSIWFGYEPAVVPFARMRVTGKRGETARQHLDKAIATYRKILTLKPEKPYLYRLGLGWALQQAGDKQAATDAYRQAVDESWGVEGKKNSHFGNFVTVEAVGYLKPLLDPEKDAKELAELDRRVEYLMSLPRAITPVAVPLQDGLSSEDLFDPTARVAFDLDGTGRPLEWPWLRPGKAAWLVHDAHGTGRISSALQLFGTRTFNLFLDHGYEGLSLLDDNGDGVLRDKELEGLHLWHDINSDGVSDPGEVQSLAHWQISVLGCESALDADGVRHVSEGVRFKDGKTRPTWDLIFEAHSAE